MRRNLVRLNDLATVARQYGHEIEYLETKLGECALAPAERSRLSVRLRQPDTAVIFNEGLQHRLSRFTSHLAGSHHLREGTSDREAMACRDLRVRLDQLPASGGGAWKSTLIELAGHVGVVGSIRTKDVTTTPDSHGRCVLFPDSRTFDGRIRELNDLVGDASIPTSFAAIILLCCMLNLHPLTDGNGRVSRVMFNWALLRHRQGRDRYLPLYEIKQCSRYGFELSLRELELTGSWGSVLDYFTRLVACMDAGKGRRFE